MLEQNGPCPTLHNNNRNRFHSDKICDISYANIQGKESLIEKFRNSCVMDEDPSYRPKIFHSSGPLMGQEQEFPEPNNTRRKLRSIACARQIGLLPSLTLLWPCSIIAALSRFLDTFLPDDWLVNGSLATFRTFPSECFEEGGSLIDCLFVISFFISTCYHMDSRIFVDTSGLGFSFSFSEFFSPLLFTCA